MSLTRRELLQRSGWVAGGLTVFTSCRLLPVLPTFTDVDGEAALVWVQMRADGGVVFLCPRSEMGQGIATGLTQVVAEELVVSMSAIECVYPRTDQIAPMPMTVGSQSIEQFFVPTARAAASLRVALQERAARHFDVAVSEVDAAPGAFVLADGRRVSHAELIGSEEATLVPAGAAEVVLLSQRPRAERACVGRDRQPVHIDRLVTGAEVYSRDVQLPDMAFGAVARPPQIGSELRGFDANAARGVAGVVAVVEGPSGQVGVVAETPMAAERGIEALACRWSELDADSLARVQRGLDIDAAIDDDVLDHTPVDEGDLAAGRERAERHLDARYDTPMVAHAAMEPRSGVARVEHGRCEVWTGSQDPWFVQRLVARALGVSESRVVVQNQRIGGAFGGRVLCQASVEAAWLAAGAGRPVKVQWSRREEFAHNYVGPQFSHRIRAGTDASGGIVYWHHRMVGSPILLSSTYIPPGLHWVADLPADPGTWRGADLPYLVPNRRLDFADLRTPMPTGSWRGLGAAPNTFAVECAIDELAEGAGADPIQFRQRHASSERLVGVLERVRALSEWEALRADGAQLGVAAAAYKNVTFVAVVARVSVERGEPRVEGLWCVQDCGVVVCPDQVRAQVEGNLAWGISMALHEEFRMESGSAATLNFDRYSIARNADVPVTAVELVDSELPPSGSGEAAFAPAAAAIVNAVSHARGERLRRLPLIRRA